MSSRTELLLGSDDGNVTQDFPEDPTEVALHRRRHLQTRYADLQTRRNNDRTSPSSSSRRSSEDSVDMSILGARNLPTAWHRGARLTPPSELKRGIAGLG